MKKFNNNDFSNQDIDKNVTVFGWVNRIRNIGELIFVDLRDRSGILQIVFDKNNSANIFNLANTLKNEYCLKISGTIRKRQDANLNIASGEVELIANDLEILAECDVMPFNINDDSVISDAVGLKYRYLMLRREKNKKILLTKHQITRSVRNYLDNLGFIEVETPILSKSTPEGARDYIVPSRIKKGSFYALPQSPQLYKQLLMVGGFEKYYQIARCFRDEDLRADRQPEFTQIDLEMSFATEEDVFEVAENMIKRVVKDIKGIDLPDFPRITYKEAIDSFGTDKPDTRFAMLITDLTNILKSTEFNLYKSVIDNNGVVKCIVVKNDAEKISRKLIDEYNEFVKQYKGKGISFLKYSENEFSGSVAKNLEPNLLEKIKVELKLENNDLVIIMADAYKIVSFALGALRIKIAKYLNLINPNLLNFLWITNFPMFEYSESEGRYMAAHHPFTMPNDIKLLSDKENCYARAYDIVINGYELASGSVRIHDPKIQAEVFKELGISDEEAKQKFGFFLDAFKFGAPPHAGIAPGLDRLTMILCQTDDIKDVIAFPKIQNASDLMNESPSIVNQKQLNDLGIKIIEEKND